MRHVTLPEALVVAERVLGQEFTPLRNPELCRLLDSALHAPQATFDGVDLLPSTVDKAASLCRHVCPNHPFPDGNKRMAWVLTLLFLRLNGHEMIADDFRAICVMVETASSSTSHEEISSAFARWMRPLQQAAV